MTVEDQFEDLEEFHKVNDMAMVTFLNLRGHATQGVRFEGGTCYWFFRNSDGLVKLIDEFSEGTALVEPREYNKAFSQTKREMYQEKDRRTGERLH